MAQTLPPAKGIQAIPAAQIPAQWDATWFLKFLKTWLAPADVRNATGVGITITGNGTQNATLTATGDGTAAGEYNPTFSSGNIQYTGPNNSFDASNNFIVGTQIPTPATPFPGGAAMLLGSGGGNGTPISFWIVQDAPFDDVTPGNNLGISAGESDGAQQGGQLFCIGGASASGQGGTMQVQGGTSTSGLGGEAVLQGGNSTSNIPGDAFVSGGQTGTQGANVHLIMTTVAGTSGVVRIRVNSTPLIDFYASGAIYLYNGGGFGTAGQKLTTGGNATTAAYWS